MRSTQLTAKESRLIFRCERNYTVRDVIDAAYVRGDLKRHWEELLRGVEAENEANESDLETDDEAIAAAAEAFRYQHDLITAEETERWLEERVLTLEEFSDYFIREFWRKVLAQKALADEIAYPSASPEQRDSLIAELFLSGEFDRMTRLHSWQVAAASATRSDDLPAEVVNAERDNFLAREEINADELPSLLEQLERDPAWFTQTISEQARYRRECEKLVSGAAPNQELANLRLPLTRFDLEIIEVESRDAAAEALLCVREDGMTMEEVATEAGYPYRSTTVLLEDLPADSQQKFLSVSPGQVLEPMPRGEEGFQLCRVTNKSEPTLDDVVVRERIETRILERHFAELSAKHITWASGMQPS